MFYVTGVDDAHQNTEETEQNFEDLGSAIEYAKMLEELGYKDIIVISEEGEIFYESWYRQRRIKGKF